MSKGDYVELKGVVVEQVDQVRKARDPDDLSESRQITNGSLKPRKYPHHCIHPAGVRHHQSICICFTQGPCAYDRFCSPHMSIVDVVRSRHVLKGTLGSVLNTPLLGSRRRSRTSSVEPSILDL